jgi:single-strand DNA-binding protein
MLNRVILIGRLTKDPELRYTPNGNAVASFSIAVDRAFSGGSGEREVDFINIVTWNKTAENVANYMKKGRLVAVDGRIQTRNYENNEGKKVYVTEVVAESVRFLDSGKDSREDAAGEPRYSSNQDRYSNASTKPEPAAKSPFAEIAKPINLSDDDLPF